MRRTAVLGLGNVLLGDDALGPWVIRALEAWYEIPEGVSLLDVGTPGLDLTPHLSGLDRVIIVDTVRSEGAPGEIRVYDREAILRHPPQARVSPHDPGLKEALLTLELSDASPAWVTLVGVIPQGTDTGTGLSEPVRNAVPDACRRVVEELSRWGLDAEPFETPRTPEIWWEEGGGSER